MGSFVETKIDLGSALHGSHDYFFAVVSKLPEITPLSVTLLLKPTFMVQKVSYTKSLC